MDVSLPVPLWFETVTEDDRETVIAKERERAKSRRLVCAACGSRITSEKARIEVTGGHEHSFFNPHGIVFLIGCFNEASGCRQEGPASSEFSWFPGFSWRVACCRKCVVHLGWAFGQGTTTSFYGLILNRLIHK